MASWRPKTELEHEIVSQQPELNFIYGDLTDQQKKSDLGFVPRPPAHLEYIKNRTKNNEDGFYNNGLRTWRNIQKMVSTKPLGTAVDLADLDNTDNIDRETVAMIRDCGMGPTIDMPLNEKFTRPTFPVPNDVQIVHNRDSKMPILYNDDHFKVVSTRMRNKIMREKIKAIDNAINEMQINGKKIEKKSKIDKLSALNDEEVEEEPPTQAEKTAKKYKDFLAAYPELGSDKKRSSNIQAPPKNGKKCQNSDRHLLENDKNKKYHNGKSSINVDKVNRKTKNTDSSKEKISWGLSTTNDSSFDSSSYYDCNSNSFRSNSSTSSYETANESLSWRRRSETPTNETLSWRRRSETPTNTSGCIRDGHGNERCSRGSQVEQKLYYSPMDVYRRKREK